nr:hypothetical protein [Mycobacterium leprae]
MEWSLVSLLNIGSHPRTWPDGRHALEGQLQFTGIVGDVSEMLLGRTLVAHNAAFAYAFFAAEAEILEPNSSSTVPCARSSWSGG